MLGSGGDKCHLVEESAIAFWPVTDRQKLEGLVAQSAPPLNLDKFTITSVKLFPQSRGGIRISFGLQICVFALGDTCKNASI